MFDVLTQESNSTMDILSQESLLCSYESDDGILPEVDHAETTNEEAKRIKTELNSIAKDISGDERKDKNALSNEAETKINGCSEAHESTAKKSNIYTEENKVENNVINSKNIITTNKKKKEKIIVVNKKVDYFEEKEEEKIFAVHARAYEITKKLEDMDIRSGEILAAKEIAKIGMEWPALFGAETDKIYVHVDLDCFFCLAESVTHPEYRDIPMAVGSTMMLSATNYKAREFGVKSGMPGFMGLSHCPQLKIVKPNFSKYNSYSEQVMEILSCYDRDIEIYGIDEACLVFDGKKLRSACDFMEKDAKNGLGADKSSINLKDAEAKNNAFKFGYDAVYNLIDKVRKVVHINTGLTLSAGISVSRGLSKFSSNINKPNGQFMIPSDFDGYILDLAVDEINGIGKYTKEVLEKAMGVKTVRDLRNNLGKCALAFRAKTFSRLCRLSFGLSVFDHPSVETTLNRAALSVGIGYSFKPTKLRADLLNYLWAFSETLERRLKRKEKSGRILTLQVKHVTYSTISKQHKADKYMRTQEEIFENATLLMDQAFHKKEHGYWMIQDPIRMLGLSVSELVKTKNIQRLEDFPEAKVRYKERKCIICNSIFINETRFSFELHVNDCLDRKEKEEKKKKNTLWHYMDK
ncbi:DNA polymerase kappa [Enteropsectra breve]|nr:DNA polymerase kappa [Enteropsectra breve]